MTQSTPSPSETPDESSAAEAPETVDASSDASTDSMEGGAWTATGEDLPELEELTPELVEEEAIRGDFMLRGAAILLAVLFGCLQIADSSVLVHIRSGEQMRENGFLPGRTDTFSFATEGQPTANVSWLFDHLVSGIWMLGGPLGLTLFKAFVAGFIAWVLTRISVPGLPTWWSSICGVVALAGCASDLMPIPDLMTLLGIVLILKLLHEAYQGTVSGLVWKAPLIMAIWANLDSHAFLGVIALALFSAGSVFARTPGENRSTTPSATLWTATALSAVALLIHPFPVASALSVVRTYLTEYPGARALLPLRESTVTLLDGRLEAYSLLNVDAWGGFEFSYIAALAVLFLAAVTIVLTRDHREAPWAFLLTGFAALAIVTIHELMPAALVAAAVASVVGQRYYQKTFPQEYTTKPAEVLFSRFGRAVTVFSFALIGFLLVTDRVPTRTAVGTGFTSDFETTIVTLDEQLKELPEDARVLHTRVDFGDFLIWSGRQSFVDTRITPFGVASDPESPNQRYRTIRQDMLDSATLVARSTVARQQQAMQEIRDAQQALAGSEQPVEPATADTEASVATDTPDATDALDATNVQSASGSAPETATPESAAEARQAVMREADESVASLDELLQKEGITHAATGLYPPGNPHIRTLIALISAPDTWTMTHLEPSAAIFAYAAGAPDSDQPVAYDPIKEAFDDVEPEPVQRFEFARPKGFYDRYLYRTRASVPTEMRIARNMLSLQATPANLLPALRAINRLLARDDQNAQALQLQAMIYSRLASWEGQIASQSGSANPADMRYLQIIMAARQAVTVDPELGTAWNLLYQVYVQRGRVDLALECLRKAMPSIRQSLLANPTEGQQNTLDQLISAEEQLAQAVAQIELQRDEMLKQNPAEDPNQRIVQKYAIAEQVATMGHITAALEMLRESQESIKNVPQLFARAETLRGQLLLESGELQESFELYLQLGGMAQQQQETAGQAATFPWTSTSFITKIGLGGYPQADEEITRHISALRYPSLASPVVKGNLASLPLVASVETLPQSDVSSRWPVTHLFSCRVPMLSTPQSLALPRLMQAIAQLEAGDVESARINFQGLINECGQTVYRPLAAAYLSLLRDDFEDYMAYKVLNTWEPWDESDFEDAGGGDAANNAASEGDSDSEDATEDGEDSESTEPIEPSEEETKAEPAESGESAGEESSSDEPATDDSATEPPASEESASEEPAAEESATEESASDEPASDETPPTDNGESTE